MIFSLIGLLVCWLRDHRKTTANIVAILRDSRRERRAARHRDQQRRPHLA